PEPAVGVLKVWVQMAVSPVARVPLVIVGMPSEAVVPSATFVSVTAVTVISRWATVNDSSVLGAAAQVPLPAWEARIVHVPAVTIVTLVPETVHTEAVSDAKPTGRPLVAVAVIPPGASP